MPRQGLNKARLVEAAAALVDDAGTSDGLTLTELAKAVGTRVPSLYNHVAGLDGLRRDLALWGITALHAALQQAAVGQSGRAALCAMARAYRDFARAHPGVYPLTLRAADPRDLEMQQAQQSLIELLSIVLDAAHLSGDEALHAIRGLRSAMHGFVSLETSGGFALPLDLDESYARLIDAYLDSLPL